MPAREINKQIPQIIKFWLPVLLFMALIFFLSSIPGADIPALFVYQDVISHLVTYFILACFFARALKHTYSNLSSLKIILYTVVFAVAYGVSDEFHQAFVPGRVVSGLDVMVDGVGSLIGGLIFH